MKVRVGEVAIAPDVVHPDEMAFPRRPVGGGHGGDLLGDGGDPLVAQVSVEQVLAWKNREPVSDRASSSSTRNLLGGHPGRTFPPLRPGFSVGVRDPQAGVRWHGDGPGLPWRGTSTNLTSLPEHHTWDFPGGGGGRTPPTPRGLGLPHFGLDHVGLDGAAEGKLVVIGDGASPVLQVQEGVGRLGALRRLADAGQGPRPRVPVDRDRHLVTPKASWKQEKKFRKSLASIY